MCAFFLLLREDFTASIPAGLLLLFGFLSFSFAACGRGGAGEWPNISAPRIFLSSPKHFASRLVSSALHAFEPTGIMKP